MSDYVCSQCGCGFPEKQGRVRVRNPQWVGDPKDADSRLMEWVIKLDNAFISAFKSAYYIKCPECGHKVSENNDGE